MTDFEFQVRAMQKNEISIWGALRSKLWPTCKDEENQRDFKSIYIGEGNLKIVLLAFIDDVAIGFAEIGERSVVDGCDGTPIAYIEGWYVEPIFQKQGIGSHLIRAAIAWAKDQNYKYFASDVELDNANSQRAHESVGFCETGRVVNYHMKLSP